MTGWHAVRCTCGCPLALHAADGHACSRHFLTCQSFVTAPPVPRPTPPRYRPRLTEGNAKWKALAR